MVLETVMFPLAKIPFPAQLAVSEEMPFLVPCRGKHLSTSSLLLGAAGAIPALGGDGEVMGCCWGARAETVSMLRARVCPPKTGVVPGTPEAERARGAGGQGVIGLLEPPGQAGTREPCPQACEGLHRGERWPGASKGSCPHPTQEEVVVQEQDHAGIAPPVP